MLMACVRSHLHSSVSCLPYRVLRVQEVKREADWFRIGFEPIFVDLSKLGCFYLIFLLVKVVSPRAIYGTYLCETYETCPGRSLRRQATCSELRLARAQRICVGDTFRCDPVRCSRFK